VAQQLISRFSVVRPPVPVQRMAEALGAEVVLEPYRGDRISGMLHREDGRAIIGINSLENHTRQRFSLAHEMGHMLLHKGRFFLDGKVNFRSSRSALGKDREEIEANVFASNLLMPEHLVRASTDLYWSRAPYSEDSELVRALARQFDVSNTAMHYRLVSLGLLRVE
jgi:Zn-dependent peptidase ImmA (M78 family)